MGSYSCYLVRASSGSPWLRQDLREGAVPPEDDVLMGERSLAEERARYEDEGREDEVEAMEYEVREAFATRSIVAGRTYPRCDATVARLVERSLGVERP